MTNKTYTHFKTDDAHWLVPGEVFNRPQKSFFVSPDFPEHLNLNYKKDLKAYTNWLTAKEGWIKIHPDHYREFEGRTGLEIGKHFRVEEFDTQDQYEDGSWARSYSTERVAIPIPQQQEEESDWDDALTGVPVRVHPKTEEYFKQHFTIKRK